VKGDGMQAIILAAGMGKRLGKLTQNNTKCMVEVGGVRLIERALYILDKKNLSRIVMVVGYQCENLMQFVDGLGIDTPVEYIINEVYDRTNGKRLAGKRGYPFAGIGSDF
jgi:choline kinase